MTNRWGLSWVFKNLIIISVIAQCHLSLSTCPFLHPITCEFQEVVDVIDTDSSADEQDDGDDFEDAPESFQVDDDIFIDNVQPTKTLQLSKFQNLSN